MSNRKLGADDLKRYNEALAAFEATKATHEAAAKRLNFVVRGIIDEYGNAGKRIAEICPLTGEFYEVAAEAKNEHA